MRYNYCSAPLVIAIIFFTTICYAAAPAKLHLSATVLPFVSFNAVQNVTSYQIKSEDIQRGYLDLPNAITVKVQTNLKAGVPIIVENFGAAKVLIKESGSPGFAENAFTVRITDSRPNTAIIKSYDSRIVLSSDTKEGSYPLTISITPAI